MSDASGTPPGDQPVVVTRGFAESATSSTVVPVGPFT